MITTKASLTRHLKVVHAKEDAKVRYPCSKCSYQATTKRCLNVHIQVVHGTGLPCKISNCNKTFKNPSGLRDHIKINHEGLSIKCD